MSGEDVLTAPNVIEYPFRRTTGPVIGAFLLTGISEGLQELLSNFGFDTPGAKRVFYGVCLLLVVMVLPNGIWPPIARLLRLQRRETPEG